MIMGGQGMGTLNRHFNGRGQRKIRSTRLGGWLVAVEKTERAYDKTRRLGLTAYHHAYH